MTLVAALTVKQPPDVYVPQHIWRPVQTLDPAALHLDQLKAHKPQTAEKGEDV